MPDLTVEVSDATTMSQDMDAAHLPPNVFTTIRNMRVVDGAARRVGSEQKFLTQTSLAATSIIPVRNSSGNGVWFIGTPTKAYALENLALSEITRAAGVYTSGAWCGGPFSGALVVTNGVEVPQVWNPVAASQVLVALPNWLSTWRAKVIRPYLRVLVALGISISGTAKPYLLATSHPADPGALPSSWDPTDPTKDIINVDVADTEDILVDGLALGQVFVIYKENTTWLMYPYGSGGGGLNTLFRIQGLYRESGLLSKDCVSAFGGDAQGRGSKHFVVTGDDIIVNNGQQAQSVLTKRLRKWLNANIDGTNYASSFAVTHDNEHEVRFHFPSVGSAVADMVLMWNWDTGALSVGETTPLKHVAYGRFDAPSGDFWDPDSGTWDTDPTSWDDGTNLKGLRRGLGVGGDSIYIVDDQTFSAPMLSNAAQLERLDFPFVMGDQGPVLALDNYKFYKWFWPRIEAASGTTFSLYFGGRNNLGKDTPIVWKPTPRSFTVGGRQFVEVNGQWKYLSFRIECATPTPWKFLGFTLGVNPRGRFG